MLTVVYGPPGVGKTTFTRASKGIDLEDMDDLRARKRVILDLLKSDWTKRDLVVGAADTQREHWGAARGDIRHVLVAPPRDVYNARRKARDAKWPAKAAQGDYYDAFVANKDHFDEVWADFPAASPPTNREGKRK